MPRHGDDRRRSGSAGIQRHSRSERSRLLLDQGGDDPGPRAPCSRGQSCKAGTPRRPGSHQATPQVCEIRPFRLAWVVGATMSHSSATARTGRPSRTACETAALTSPRCRPTPIAGDPSVASRALSNRGGGQFTTASSLACNNRGCESQPVPKWSRQNPRFRMQRGSSWSATPEPDVRW